MKTLLVCSLLFYALMFSAKADYPRNEAVAVEKVLFGQVSSVRKITQTELIQDRNNGWKVFGGALIGGAIGNQFGSGSGRALSTILGVMLGGSIASDHHPRTQQINIQLVELMISTDTQGDYMVVQDLDPNMVFHAKDKIRMIYLADGSVRIDKQF